MLYFTDLETSNRPQIRTEWSDLTGSPIFFGGANG
jgi:hypothetical protein